MDERLSNKFDMAAIESAVKLLNNPKYNICAFGTGEIGTGKGVEFVELFGRHIDFYCDNNSDKWGTVIDNNIQCISLIELEQQKEHTICFILAGRLAIREIYKQLDSMGVAGIIPYDDVVMHTFLTDKFYDFDYQQNRFERVNELEKDIEEDRKEYPQGDRIAVYTCILGGYDRVKEPLVTSDICDYYLISDERPKEGSVYRWINIKEAVPEANMELAMQNRYVKMFPNQIFPEYKYSIYLDGSIQVIGNIEPFIKNIGKTGIAAFLHPVRDSIYQEGVVCALYGMADEKLIKNQVEYYYEQGMPDEYGLFEMGVIVRQHNITSCMDIMQQWWGEINKWARRDQISFTYVLWKNGFKKDDIGVLGQSIAKTKSLNVMMHK